MATVLTVGNIMAKPKPKNQEARVVPELKLVSPLGEEFVQTFDIAWHRLMELPVPAHSEMVGFVRVDA